MRLHRVEIENWRGFTGAPRVFELAPGATLVSGPNESGKSTLFDAIRAALFDMTGTKGFEDISPWDSAGALPRVVLEFEATDGGVWRIEKTLGEKGKALLERFDGEQWIKESRDKVACRRVIDILMATPPQKGRSQPRHWGALRWLFMSDAERPLPDADQAAIQELTAGVSCVSPEFDRVTERARAEYARWFTRTGREAKSSELKLARAELTEAERKVADLRGVVERGDADRERHRELAARQPGVEAALATERAATEELARQKTSIESERTRIETLVALETRERDRVESLERSVTTHRRLRERHAEAERALHSALELRTREELRAERTRDAAEAAEAELTRSEEAVDRARQDHQAARLRRARDLDRAVEAAGAACIEGPDEAEAAEARRLHAERDRLRERAAAGSLDVELEGVVGARVLVDGAEVEACGGKALRLVRIELPGGGAITVRSPVTDAAEAAREAQAADAALTEILARWNVHAIADLEALARRARHTRDELTAARRERALFDDAPTGDLERDLEELPPTAGDVESDRPIDEEALRELGARVTAAQQAAARRRASLETARGAKTEADESHARARASETAAQSTHRERRDALEKHRESGVLENLERELTGAREALAEHAAARAELEGNLTPRLESLREQYAAAVERRDAAERSARDLGGEIAALEHALSSPETAAAWSDLGRAEREVVRIGRRIESLRIRSEAARVAKEALEAVRGESSRAMIEPIADRLKSYVAEVTRGRWSVVELDGNLHPTKLGQHDFSLGSEGVRELVPALVRVCVAIHLAERGPQCLILDDPCARVSSDRLQPFARLLHRVVAENENLQLVLLTNRPQEFRDLEGERITLDEDPDGGPTLRLRA